MLKVVSVTKTYYGRNVVDNVSLEVNAGEIVGLLGPNGAGKTTTFYMIVGVVRPDGGQIFLDGEDITHLPIHIRARMGIGYLPQEASIFRKLTVRENIMLPLQHSDVPSAEREKFVDRVLQEFGIEELGDYKGYMLSGGERRRVEVSRSLVNAPKVILLDEPFSGIDPITVYDIQGMILKLKSRGFGVLITDHNVRDTLAITDRAYLIYEGKVMVHGRPDEVAASSIARKLYLGQRFRM
ncbi:MAG: LPS export ABC transporter ATP-binding protein [Synergistetes bacterium]|nr:LPS export ABC transporter ATP-binding protein [Synergistota bacterium]